ncbi:MAG: endolytic transglycosylase MltG [Ignavibacteriae bacterium]|nr:MAG: endolytic transglycosylase MltG [Ignavibacteriota bacterium]
MKLKILYSAAFIFVFVLFMLVYFLFLNKTYRNSYDEAVVKINRGQGLSSVARELEKEGVIYNRYVFIAAGRLFGYQENIIPGEYRFGNGLTNIDILKMITDPFLTRNVTLTIPEGLNIRQIGRLLSRQFNLDSVKFVNEAGNDSLLSELGVEAENLEGFLFPDTYNLNISARGGMEREIVRIMFSEFKRKVTTVMYEEMKRRKLKLKDVVTMASIIEGETRFKPEKKIIAGVYYNRLKKRMKLEADPTVQYVLPGGPKRRLAYSDLKFESPYNTYLHTGLPPGPINNPGLSSILAAIYPEENNYLYFVAKGDGSHRFASTFDEHKQNIQQYRKYLQELENKKSDTLK